MFIQKLVEGVLLPLCWFVQEFSPDSGNVVQGLTDVIKIWAKVKLLVANKHFTMKDGQKLSAWLVNLARSVTKQLGSWQSQIQFQDFGCTGHAAWCVSCRLVMCGGVIREGPNDLITSAKWNSQELCFTYCCLLSACIWFAYFMQLICIDRAMYEINQWQ